MNMENKKYFFLPSYPVQTSTTGKLMVVHDRFYTNKTNQKYFIYQWTDYEFIAKPYKAGDIPEIYQPSIVFKWELESTNCEGVSYYIMTQESFEESRKYFNDKE